MHIDSKADHTLSSNVKAQKVRVLITSDILLCVPVLDDSCESWSDRIFSKVRESEKEWVLQILV